MRPWLLAALGLAGYCLLVWFAGPLLSVAGETPLAAPLVRGLVCAAFVLPYLLQKAWSGRRARRDNERVIDALASDDRTAVSDEAAVLRERFAAALATLRHARFGARGGGWSSLSWKFGRQYLYELPWYLIIGAPGAGKTTALLNCGLRFPLEASAGRGAVKGYGGTRNCDWWFTDRAVLIDTAGRYTTHEADAVADRKAWESFLGLLRSARPRRPINALLVAVSMSDLLAFEDDELAAHARTLRARIDEVQRTLGRRVPAYLLFTKCDLLPGFAEWFNELDRGRREQVWGFTLPWRDSVSGAAPGACAAHFDRLVARLSQGLVARLQAERDLRRRARILALPRQLRELRARLDGLAHGVFGGEPGAAPRGAALRGVYLTSATQEGTPIDRMLSALGRTLGLQAEILAPPRAAGKSFFLAGLLARVVLPEAELGGRRAGTRWAGALALAGIGLVLAGAAWTGVGWLASYRQASGEIDRAGAAAARVAAALAPGEAASGADPRPLLPALDALQAYADERLRLARVPAAGPLDLAAAPRRKLAAAGRQAYERLLLGPLQERIARSIDALLRTGADIDLQYEALKAYAMLNEPAHFDAGALKAFVIYQWDRRLEPPLEDAQRRALVRHLDALLAAGAVGSGTTIAPALIASVRARLAGAAPAQRVATRFAALLGAGSEPDFTLADAVPATALPLFTGADGKSPPQPVPGRYTLAAWRDGAPRRLDAIAAQLAAEAPWVLEAPAAGAPDSSSAARVAEQVLDGYRADYARAWVAFLDDVHLARARGRDDALRQAQALGAEDGPLAALLHAVAAQVQPVVAAGDDRAAPGLERLRRFLADGPGEPMGLAATLKAFREIASLRTTAGAAGGTSEAVLVRLARIRADARDAPDPVGAMLLALAVAPEAAAAVAGVVTAPSSPVARELGAHLAIECGRWVPGFFPFDRNAAREIPLDEFARLFAPRGAFDQTFERLLAAHVDTAADPWRLRDRAAGIDSSLVLHFQSAARIRAMFFPGGQAAPALRLAFRPIDLDDSIDRFELEIDGQKVRYAHGPQTETVIDWPGAQGGARIEAAPAGETPPPSFSGAWALFRLFDAAAMQAADQPGHYRVVFNLAGRRASFDLGIDAPANPFRFSALERFTCPSPGP